MSKNSATIEKALRHRVDPERLLPFIRLLPLDGPTKSPLRKLRLLQEFTPVGSIELLDTALENGAPVTRIDSIVVSEPANRELVRRASVLNLLAGGLALASSQHGSTEREVAMWYWLAGNGLAVVPKHFEPQLIQHEGEAIWTGQAIAPPVTLFSSALHREIGSDI